MASATLQTPPPLKHETLNAIKAIIDTVDEHARDVNRRWGCNRLPHLVPIEWTERFLAQKRKWEAATFECVGSLLPDDLDRVRAHGDAMIRAYDKLGEIAVQAGHLPVPPDFWTFELKDGTPVVLVRDRAELAQVSLDGRKGQIWSLEEVADIVARFPDIARAKECFPGAQVIQVRTSPVVRDKLDDELGDVPW